MPIKLLLESWERQILPKLQGAKYLLSDARIPWVSLYDHLALTAGLAAAMTAELVNRGVPISDICGLELAREELVALARLCGLLHDVGKAQIGVTEYRWHVQRGIEYIKEWLDGHKVDDPLRSVIMGTIARHHLRDNPQSFLEKLVCLANSYASAGDRSELARAETRAEFESTIRATQQLEQELFGSRGPMCLLLGDADTIKGYVYEGNSLPEIRGGSEILQDIEEALRERFRDSLAPECLIYCGGGGFLAFVPSSEAGHWRSEVEQLYARKTCVATVTVVISDPVGYSELSRGLAPYDVESVRRLRAQGIVRDLFFAHYRGENVAVRKNFGELVAFLTGKLQQAKRQKTVAPFVETMSIHRRCQSCGKRPASAWDTVRSEWLCSVCQEKRRKGREGRRWFIIDFNNWMKWTQQGQPVEGKGAADLDGIAGPEGKIALLYADGNNIGDLLQRASSPAAYRHISQALERAVRESLFAALLETFGKERVEKGTLPFEIVALGGDDAIVIVPASAGWALGLAMAQHFSQHAKIQELQEELGNRSTMVELTLSVGIAIADVKYPVQFLFTLAGGLLKEAKRLARTTRKPTVCHLWLRAPVLSETAGQMLLALFHREKQLGLRWWLTARPYTVEQGQQLHQIARGLQSFPASLRRSLAESLEKGVHVSLNYALYQAARHRQGSQLRQLFERLGELLPPENMLHEKNAVRGFWFWREQKEGQQRCWRT
ncbi:MAG: HD domain-containing protein, partial [Candidatus Kapabacteria bacterium]|nr:HD domain-containing protein [Candidatus Kapabacteria bacterium]MDW7996218.1 HD domain-containing protein [Bacteroidota bacterium]